MTISSLPVPSTTAPTAAAGGPGEATAAGPPGPFALLLPADGAGDPKAPAGETGGQDAETETDQDAVPIQAEQSNLAALLYALPAATPGRGVEGGEVPAGQAPVSAAAGAQAEAAFGKSDPVAQPPASDPAASAPSAPLAGGKAADLAVPQKAGAIPPQTPPANSSPAPLAALPSGSGPLVSQSPANPDVSLDAEQSPVVKKARGTTGAKPDRDMNDAPAANQKPSPGVPAPRSAAAGLAAASAGLGEEQPGRSQKDAPDLNAAGKEEGNRGTPESAAVTFSAPHLRPVTANGADLATSAAKPMTSAAVLDEVGLGLERLQQHGNNRMDLRLSLQDGGQVSIELQVRDGAVHASFLTGSAELQNALQQGWSQLVNRSESLGLSLAEPVFKTPTAASANAGQQDFRERRHEPPQEQNSSSSPYAASQQLKRTGRPNLPARPATSGLNAWA